MGGDSRCVIRSDFMASASAVPGSEADGGVSAAVFSDRSTAVCVVRRARKSFDHPCLVYLPGTGRDGLRGLVYGSGQ